MNVFQHKAATLNKDFITSPITLSLPGVFGAYNKAPQLIQFNAKVQQDPIGPATYHQQGLCRVPDVPRADQASGNK